MLRLGQARSHVAVEYMTIQAEIARCVTKADQSRDEGRVSARLCGAHDAAVCEHSRAWTSEKQNALPRGFSAIPADVDSPLP